MKTENQKVLELFDEYTLLKKTLPELNRRIIELEKDLVDVPSEKELEEQIAKLEASLEQLRNLHSENKGGEL